MPQPIIGLTTDRHIDSEGQARLRINEAYVESVSRAGGIPILVPLGLPEEALGQIVSRIDGILFTGGGDVEPRYYGAVSNDPLLDRVDPDRDRVELALFQQAIRLELPFLGICRGLQVINVAMGGSLYADILRDMPGALQHQNGDAHPRDYLAHQVEVDPASRLVRILNAQQVRVNSMHHQGIRRLGNRLIATAHAPDGLIEAFEMDDYPFGMAVQWHPECLQNDEAMRRLFRALVASAERQNSR